MEGWMDERFERIQEVFSHLILTASRMEYIMDRDLRKDGLTVKEWQVIAAIGMFFDAPPMINEVAEAISTSHQNVRRIADQLVKKGFMQVERDPTDRRAVRLKLTRRNDEYWTSKSAHHEARMRDLFSDLSDADLEALAGPLGKLAEGIGRIYREERG
jgi:DNA-binding MarR family transcriptional regulator